MLLNTKVNFIFFKETRNGNKTKEDQETNRRR